jgi:transcriptional regulator with XRE-family HTH domain
MSIGQNIRTYRKKAKLTQKDLAEKANMSRSYLTDLEADRYNPSVDTLKSIAEALNIQSHVLMGETSEVSATPEWASSKDKRDFKTLLEEDAPVMFDGVPISKDDKEKIKRVMEAMFWDAKKKNKETYGHKKKKTDE